MKHLIILSSLFFFSMTNAQQQKDILYLKNGSIIKGTIIEMNPGSNLKIQTSDGSLFIFKMDEIEKTAKESVTPSTQKVAPTSSEKEVNKSQKPTTSKPNYQPKYNELGKVHLEFQPAGFLQFGPVIGLGFRVGHNFVIGPQFRYTSLGLAYNAVNDFENTLVGFSVGFNFKHFPNADQVNKFYYGIGIEYAYGEFDDYNDWYGSSAGIVMPLNIGYRFRFGSGFYINLGAFAGSYINFYDEWFDYDDYALHDESGYAHFFGYFEFGLGVEF